MSADKRQGRQSRLLKAMLACERLGQFEVTVRNVSPSGIGGRAPLPLTLGRQMTVLLNGHDPLIGVVRWVRDELFGIEVDGEIRTDKLKTAQGMIIPSSHSDVEFRIMRPSKLRSRRPALKLGVAQDPGDGISRWEGQGW